MRTYQKQFETMLSKEEYERGKAYYIDLMSKDGSDLKKQAQKKIKEIDSRRAAIITCQLMGVEEI